MSITVTPVTGGPPMVQVTVTGGGPTMTAIVLKRTANGVTEKARWQPATGGTTATVQDVEIPWDTDVVYAATVTTSGGTSTYTAAPVTVSASDAWAIHPVYPQRSVIIDQQHPTGLGVTVAAMSEFVRASTATTHRIIGSPFPVTTTIGSRAAATGTMTLTSASSSDAANLWTLVDDQTPILIRFPDSFGVDFENGFYAIGDVASARVGVATEQRRLFTLPLTRVQAPAVLLQSAAWDYPTIVGSFTDYADLTATFADYAALTANRRS